MTHAERGARCYLDLMHRSVAPLLPLALLIGCATEGTSDVVDVPRDVYPAGPFGTAEGDVIRNHVFTAADGTALALQEVRADDDAQLLLLVTAAGWCTACIEEQPELQQLYQRRDADGLRIVVGVFEDAEFAPATAADAAEWQRDHALSFPVVADPQFELHDYYDAALSPMNMLVRLGPMTIERVSTGRDPLLLESMIEALL